jgi:hypothetical protein
MDSKVPNAHESFDCIGSPGFQSRSLTQHRANRLSLTKEKTPEWIELTRSREPKGLA